MASVPTGTILSLATVFGPVKTVTGVSNATEAVVTATHDYAIGDIVEITSGWGRLNKRAFRVKSVSTTVSFVLEGGNTVSTEFFPAGSGAGSVRKVTTWQQISKVMNPSSSGGDPKTITYKFLENDTEFQKNDGFSAVSETFEIDADEIGQAGYEALKSLSEVQTDTILKKTLKSGSLIMTPCTVALNENVIMSDGQINKCKVAIAGNNRITRYQA